MIQNIDLTPTRLTQSPLGDVFDKLRENRRKDEQDKRAAAESEVSIEQIKATLAAQKKKAEDAGKASQIIARGLPPQDTANALRGAGLTDQAQAYLEKAQADAEMQAKALTGRETPEVTNSGAPVQGAAIPDSLDGSSMGAAPPVQRMDPQTTGMPNPNVSVPAMGGAPITVNPQTATQGRQAALNRFKQQAQITGDQARETAAQNAADRAQQAKDAELARAAQARETELSRSAQAREMQTARDKESANKTVDTGGGIYQWNPNTERYDIRVGNSKPPKSVSTSSANAADSTSYKFHVQELDKRAKPLDDSAARLARLGDTLDQGTAQADTLIAPELMTVMAGGLGSGVRITNSEIDRVQGGRPMIAQIQSKIRKWLSTDQKAAIDFGPDERKAMHDLVNVVGVKLSAKQKALSDAGGIISAEGTTDQQRRTALAKLDEALRGIDSGNAAAAGSAPSGPPAFTLPNGTVVHRQPDGTYK